VGILQALREEPPEAGVVAGSVEVTDDHHRSAFPADLLLDPSQLVPPSGPIVAQWGDRVDRVEP
jgi:hypothetical protein